VHSISQGEAEAASLPLQKVKRMQYGVNYLTYSSKSMFALVCVLESIYEYNLQPDVVVAQGPTVVDKIASFALECTALREAWNRCLEEISATVALDSKTAIEVHEPVLRFIANTFRNIRGKAYAKLAEKRSSGDTRMHGVRDRLAADQYVKQNK
jgi:hypothetical protein